MQTGCLSVEHTHRAKHSISVYLSMCALCWHCNDIDSMPLLLRLSRPCSIICSANLLSLAYKLPTMSDCLLFDAGM